MFLDLSVHLIIYFKIIDLQNINQNALYFIANLNDDLSTASNCFYYSLSINDDFRNGNSKNVFNIFQKLNLNINFIKNMKYYSSTIYFITKKPQEQQSTN